MGLFFMMIWSIILIMKINGECFKDIGKIYFGKKFFILILWRWIAGDEVLSVYPGQEGGRSSAFVVFYEILCVGIGTGMCYTLFIE